MGFDVVGPSSRVCASNVDHGVPPLYDVLSMPALYGLQCPQLEKLHQRFYETTVLHNGDGSIEALRDELVALRETYRAKREPELVVERHVHARDPRIRAAIIDRVLHEDLVYRVLDDFRRVCEEAIAEGADIRCEGD